jgi:hypothetical protein
MTAKEKAEQLFIQYRSIIAGQQFITGFALMSEAKELAKQWAIIAVEEILDKDGYNQYFWNEVKHELEKL